MKNKNTLSINECLLATTKIVKTYFHIIAALFLLGSLLIINNYVTDNFAESLLEENVENAKEEPSEESISTITVQKGDTLSSILRKEKILPREANKIINLAKKENLTRNLKVGQTITFEYNLQLNERSDSDLTSEERNLSRMSLAVDHIKSIDFINENNNFTVYHTSAPLKKLITKYETTIDSSVISSLRSVGLSTTSIINLINTYSHQIDFQRDIKSGDSITVVTEKFTTEDNKLSHHGNIIYASIKTKGKNFDIYKYSPDNSASSYDFFTEAGESIKSNLLKTPVKVARISSHYGYRKKHPVLGYGAMHKGVDFAAPIGTPIYAAGSGVVEFIGWKSGYGRFIQIKHNGSMSTCYAHSSRFAKNLKKGSRVKQGEIIAYVGNSGRVTGPHLHYEVKINGKFKSTPSIKLAGKKLHDFQTYKAKILNLSSQLNKEMELAASEIKNIKLF
jgi:murein DD-endopeptidase MepM/ murein hydrolase activator NlpD